MIFLSGNLANIIIFILGVCGALVAKHIRNHKVKSTPLVCLAGFDCHTVVHSDYSKFLGIPVEILGVFYYMLISAASLLLVFVPGALPSTVTSAIFLVSLAAFLFSAYLIAVQIFILRKGCSWCIISSLISASIFVAQIFLK